MGQGIPRRVQLAADADEWLALMWLTFGRARIARATSTSVGEHWCYDDALVALFQFLNWPATPDHWHRHSYWNERGEWAQEYR